MMRVFCLILALLISATPTAAQTQIQLTPDSTNGTIAGPGTSVVYDRVRGMSRGKIQVVGTYIGTWKIVCSVDGTTYAEDNPIPVIALGETESTTTVASTQGIWDFDMGGCARIKVMPVTSSWTSGSFAATIGASPTGGGLVSSGSSGSVTITGDALVALQALAASITAGGRLAVDLERVLAVAPATEATFSFGNSATHAAIGLMTYSSGGPILLGACTPGYLLSANTVNETEIKDTGGLLMNLNVTNIGANEVFLKLYDDDADDVDQTDTPVQGYVIPGDAAGAGNHPISLMAGMNFERAITFRLTTGAANNDTGAVAANEVLVSWCYK